MVLSSHLIDAEAESSRLRKVEECQVCHGIAGDSQEPRFPKLAGQHASYLYKQLLDFRQGKQGKRFNTIMSGVTANMTQRELFSLAVYFAQQQPSPGFALPQYVARGQQLYRGGDKTKQIPACSACHGPTGAGNPQAGIPWLSGQSARYTANQLAAFKQQRRYNDSNHMMVTISERLSDEDIAAVASYIAGLHGSGR